MFSNLQAYLGVDNKEFIAGMKNSQNAVDAFANNFQAKLGKVLTGQGQQAATQFGTIGKEVNKAGGFVNQFTQRLEKMGNVFTTGLGLGIGYAGLNALTGAFSRAIEKAREFETGILSIAAAQQSAFDIKIGDRILEGAEGFQASLSLAYKANDEILKRSTQNILTYREQLNAYLVSTAQASKLGLTVKEQLDLSENLAVAAKAIGLSGQQISQQVRAILGGANVQKTVLGSALGLTNADLKRMKEAGTLFTELMDKTKGFTAGADNFGNSIEGMLSQFENAIDIFLAGAGKKIAAAVRQPLKDIQEFLASEGGSELGETLGKMFANLLKVLLEIAKSPALDIIKTFLQFLANFGDKIILAGIFLKLGGIISGFLNKLRGMVVWLTEVAASGTKAAQSINSVAAATTNASAAASKAQTQAANNRGPNAPNRFQGQPTQLALPFNPNEGVNKAGRLIDPNTGRYLPSKQPTPVQPMLTGFDEATHYAQQSAMEKKMLAQARQKQWAITQAALSDFTAQSNAGWSGYWAAKKTMVAKGFAGLRAQVAAVNVDALIGKIGMGAMLALLIGQVGDWLKDGFKEAGGNARDAIDILTSSGQFAAMGGMIAGPLGALGGAVIGAVKGMADALEKAEQEARQAEEAYKQMLAQDPALKRIQGLKDKISQQREATLDPNVTEKGKEAARKIIEQTTEELEKARKDGRIQRAAKQAAEEAENLMKSIQEKLSVMSKLATNAGDQAIITAKKLKEDMQSLKQAQEKGQLGNMRLPSDIGAAKQVDLGPIVEKQVKEAVAPLNTSTRQVNIPQVVQQSFGQAAMPLQQTMNGFKQNNLMDIINGNAQNAFKPLQVGANQAGTQLPFMVNNTLSQAVKPMIGQTTQTVGQAVNTTNQKLQQGSDKVVATFNNLVDQATAQRLAFNLTTKAANDITDNYNKLREDVTNAGDRITKAGDELVKSQMDYVRFQQDMKFKMNELTGNLIQANQSLATYPGQVSEVLSKGIQAQEERIRAENVIAQLTQQYGSKITNLNTVMGEIYKKNLQGKEAVDYFVTNAKIGGAFFTGPVRDAAGKVLDKAGSIDKLSDMILNDLQKVQKQSVGAEVQSLKDNVAKAQLALVRGVNDMNTQNSEFVKRIGSAQKEVEKANKDYAKAVTNLNISVDGFAVALKSINENFKKLGKPEVKVDFQGINVTVPVELKERIDVNQMKALIKAELQQFMVNSCRDTKR